MKFLLVVILLIIVVVFLRKKGQAKAAASKQPKPEPPYDPQSWRKKNAPSLLTKQNAFDYFYTDVGIFKPEDQELELGEIGENLWFCREPSNTYDPRAVYAALDPRGRLKIGYLYKGKLKDMVWDFLTRGDGVHGEITAVGEKLQCCLGLVRMEIPDEDEEDL